MFSLSRRDVLRALFCAVTPSAVFAAAKPSVSTLIGTGSPGQTDREVSNPYGLVIGPDRALYFCDLDNQRIRRLDFKTRRTTTVAGNGLKAYRGDGGPAADASLNMPHEVQFDSARNLYIAERDNHVVRKVDAKTGVISTFAGTGEPGSSGDGGPATRRSFGNLTALPSIPGAGCSSAISAISVFDRWILPAARSRPMGAPANGCSRLMARR